MVVKKSNQRYPTFLILVEISIKIPNDIVMFEKSWNSFLGTRTRKLLSTPYQGPPFDEPQFSLKFIPQKIFTGFAKNSRNIIWFVKDTIGRFEP